MTAATMVLLALGVAIELGCALGLLAMRDVFTRLHFLGPTTLAVLPIAVAIVIHEGASQLGIKAMLVWAILLVSGPVMAHATARAARIRQFGGWSILDTERAESEAAGPLPMSAGGHDR